MDLSPVFKTICPTIVSALAGPLGGMAIEAISSKLGISPEEAQKTLENGKLNGDQVAALQQAELALKMKAQEMGLDFAKIENEDRDSARKMQMTNHSWVPPAMAIGITLGFFGILIGLMSGKVVAGPEIEIMLGSLGTAWTGVVAFYFGSSASSQKKDDLLHKSTPVQ